MAVELGLIICSAVHTAMLAAERFDRTPQDRTARTLTAWSVTNKAATALLTGARGLLAAAAGPRTALALAGLALLATPLLLIPLRRTAAAPDGERVRGRAAA